MTAKSGRQLTWSTASIGSYLRLANPVAVASARWPPAEKPTMPIRLGSMPHSAARLRTRLTARWASSCGPSGGSPLDVARPPRTAVLEDDAGHAQRVEPRRHFFSFELPVEIPVAASRADHHRRSRVLFLRRQVNRERRLGDVGDQFGRTDQRRLMNPAGFLALDANVARRLPRPELDDQRLGRSCRLVVTGKMTSRKKVKTIRLTGGISQGGEAVSESEAVCRYALWRLISSVGRACFRSVRRLANALRCESPRVSAMGSENETVLSQSGQFRTDPLHGRMKRCSFAASLRHCVMGPHRWKPV